VFDGTKGVRVMGVKTTIGPKGVVTEKTTATTDQVVLTSSKRQNAVTVIDAATSATVSTRYTLFRPAAAGVTGSLPVITSTDVGTEFVFLKNAGTTPLLVSGANPITDGGAWTVVAATAGQTYKVMAVSGTNGFYWHVL